MDRQNGHISKLNVLLNGATPEQIESVSKRVRAVHKILTGKSLDWVSNSLLYIAMSETEVNMNYLSAKEREQYKNLRYKINELIYRISHDPDDEKYQALIELNIDPIAFQRALIKMFPNSSRQGSGTYDGRLLHNSNGTFEP